MENGVPAADGERDETLLRAVPDTVYTADMDGHLTALNRARVAGYDREALLGEHVSTIMTAESVDRGRAVIRELIDDDDRRTATFEMELVTRAGEQRPYENHVALLPPGDDGRVPGTVGVLRDVSERVARERRLGRYETLVEASGDPVYALDAEGHFTFCNAAHNELVGYDDDELLGEHVSMVLPEDAIERGEALIRELLTSDGEQRGTFEMPVRTADGETVPTENHLALLCDGGEFRGTVGILRDLTERKRRERELQRQNERLDRFAGVLSHDVRNPLNLAQGHLEIARERHDSEHLEEVDWALGRIERLVDDVLTLARQGQAPESMEWLAVATVAEAAWRTVDGDGDLVVADGVGEVRADDVRLSRLFENLFRNAVEHAGPAPRVEVGPLEAGFYVADDGPGIPERQREQVFESGYSAHEDGTGFGLAIVREVAAAHGWEVAAGEPEAGGARFEVTGVDVAGR